MFEKEFSLKDVDLDKAAEIAGAVFHELSEEDLAEIAGGQGVDARTSTPILGGIVAGVTLSVATNRC